MSGWIKKQSAYQRNKIPAHLRMFRCVTQLKEQNPHLFQVQMKYAQYSAKEPAINHYEINLKIHYYTKPEERIVLVGDKYFLGNWNISNGVRLQYDGEGWWSTKLFLYRPGVFEYKFICQSAKGQK